MPEYSNGLTGFCDNYYGGIQSPSTTYSESGLFMYPGHYSVAKPRMDGKSNNQAHLSRTGFNNVQEYGSIDVPVCVKSSPTSTRPADVCRPENLQNSSPLMSLKWYNSKLPIYLCLVHRELWLKFHQHTTEMIITKHGRRMFPVISVRFTGLDPKKYYTVYLDFFLADCYIWKFNKTHWIPVGPTEPQSRQMKYEHSESPATGHFWMSSDVVFTKLKLTNKKDSPEGNVILTSHHRYQPRVNIVESTPDGTTIPSTLMSHYFPETQFIAVTAYQNTDITQLKIDHNPFAKGFRDCFNKYMTNPSSPQRISSSDKEKKRTMVKDLPFKEDVHIPETSAFPSTHDATSPESGLLNMPAESLSEQETSPKLASGASSGSCNTLDFTGVCEDSCLLCNKVLTNYSVPSDDTLENHTKRTLYRNVASPSDEEHALQASKRARIENNNSIPSKCDNCCHHSGSQCLPQHRLITSISSTPSILNNSSLQKRLFLTSIHKNVAQY
ncbi:putative T-box protein 7 [Limulus polyphemus]|uniref:T-box protein 7 n=1 Tax=Limulus polyphemus TaxID=6850 RepID=A0ABM1TQ74_LIMPO|nr:putative T-box protein 7 [Limulus polyphemus]